ncbi:hypothetical protein [Flavobacterium sp.]|jgi:hypothetical protein|uniref:hypothetical protein n=1 Tax=Flavobacterium sp. TaxID=239 RepID=UPI0037C07FEE
MQTTDQATEIAYSILEKLLKDTEEEFVPHAITTHDGKGTLTIPSWVCLLPIVDAGYDFKLCTNTVQITFTL